MRHQRLNFWCKRDRSAVCRCFGESKVRDFYLQSGSMIFQQSESRSAIIPEPCQFRKVMSCCFLPMTRKHNITKISVPRQHRKSRPAARPTTVKSSIPQSNYKELSIRWQRPQDNNGQLLDSEVCLHILLVRFDARLTVGISPNQSTFSDGSQHQHLKQLSQ